MTRDESLAYARGYQRGARWPLHKPPSPPDPIVRELHAALIDLRDRYDNLCATFSPDDEVVLAMDKSIAKADAALTLMGEWLLVHDVQDQLKATA